MTLRRIGERTAFPIGLAPLPPAAGELVQPRDEMFDTVVAALEAGVTLIDIGPLGSGAAGDDAVTVVAEALAAWGAPSKDRIVVAGHVSREPGHATVLVERAAQQLGGPLGLCLVAGATDAEALTPAVAALAACDAVSAIGVADADRSLVREFVGEKPVAEPFDRIVAVANPFGSRFGRDAELIERCAAGRIAYLPRVPVAASETAHDPNSPFESFSAIAEQRAQSLSQLTLAWLLARADVVVPVVACSHAAEIEAAVHAADIELSEDDVAQLNAAIPHSLAVFDEPSSV